MTNNSILKPDMKVAYLRNRAKDIKQGAAQFSQLLTQLKKEEQAQYIIIEADNLEMGYMAVMYHAACMNSLRAEDEDIEEQPEYSDKPDFEWFQGGDDEKEEDAETEDAKEWRESPFRIPVIEAMDVRRNLCQQTEDYFFNSFSMQQNNAGVNDRPYWMECKDESICIVNRKTGFCTGLEEKLLPDDRFICVNGAELKGMYVGHSAPKTKALFEKTAQRINRKPKNCSAFCQ